MAAIGGIYFSSPAALTNGQEAEVLIDSLRRLVVVGPGSGGAVIQGGTYNLAPPALTNGATSSFQLDSQGNVRVAEQFAPVAEDNTNGVYAMLPKAVPTSTYSSSTMSSFGAAITAVAKATPGNVLSIWASNANAAVRYLQLHNKATTVLAGDVPIYSFPIPALGANPLIIGTDFFTLAGKNFSVGVAWAFSTTGATYTAATAADHYLQGHYV